MTAPITSADIEEILATGRTYLTFDFGTDMAVLIPEIIEAVQAEGMPVPTITLAGSNVLLVAHPEAIHEVQTPDPDGEEG